MYCTVLNGLIEMLKQLPLSLGFLLPFKLTFSANLVRFPPPT